MTDSNLDRLREPFPDEFIFYKPRPACRDCTQAPDRVCKRHTKKTCPRCRQYLTEAHVDLEYVGHADVTRRLLEVDHAWFWEPAYKNPDKDVLLSAIATGNAEIVASVLDNAPPLTDKYGGMWMYLTIHDEKGRQITRLAYGDAQQKTGPDAIKETIGDGIRNGAMRFGAALDQWSKYDRPDEANDETETSRETATQRAKNKNPTAKSEAKTRPDTPNNFTETKAVAPHYDERAAELAVLAWELAEKGAGQDDLREKVYEPARRQRLLSSTVADPWSDEVRECQLSAVITAAKNKMWPPGSEGEKARQG